MELSNILVIGRALDRVATGETLCLPASLCVTIRHFSISNRFGRNGVKLKEIDHNL